MTCYHCFSEFSDSGSVCPECGYDGTDAENYPEALPHGSILNGRYIIGQVLGQGGFGITYIAQDVHTRQRFAIKEFFPESLVTRTSAHRVTAHSQERLENFQYGMKCFLAEAQTLAQFRDTQQIVSIHSYFEENGTAYFVMDYVDGVSLKAYLKDKGGKISWEEACTILLPIVDALTIVHSKGIIHRDIAPDNIYITKDGSVRLLDFGAARYSLGDRSHSLDVVLKAGYAPKEQYTRRGRQGPYTDVYAIAATFYRTITGRVPPESVDRMDGEDELVLPSSYGVRLPIWAENALEKGLAVRAADRYQTMEEFRAALTKQKPCPPPEDEKSQPMPGWVKFAAAAAAVLGILLILPKEGSPEPVPETTVAAMTEAAATQPQTVPTTLATLPPPPTESAPEEITWTYVSSQWGYLGAEDVPDNIEYAYITDDVVQINMDAFKNCTSLKQVRMPEGIKIGNGAFRYCTGLEEVEIPENTKYIDHYAFEGCTALRKVIIPSSVAWIRTGAFKDCPNLAPIVVGPNTEMESNIGVEWSRR